MEKAQPRAARIKPGLTDGRRWAMYDYGWRALNERDHEDVAVTAVAKAARCSVGAFYARFADKDAFLDFVVFERLRWARVRAEAELHPARWAGAAQGDRPTGVARHLLAHLHGDLAGVARTALRRGELRPERVEPLSRYRQEVGEIARALCLGPEPAPARALTFRAAWQIVTAAALDSLMHPHGPLRRGTALSTASLSSVLAGALSCADEACLDPALENVKAAEDEPLAQSQPSEYVAVALPGERTARAMERGSAAKPRPAVRFV